MDETGTIQDLWTVHHVSLHQLFLSFRTQRSGKATKASPKVVPWKLDAKWLELVRKQQDVVMKEGSIQSSTLMVGLARKNYRCSGNFDGFIHVTAIKVKQKALNEYIDSLTKKEQAAVIDKPILQNEVATKVKECGIWV